MKTVIFAGGYGTRLQEVTVSTPKPMVEIGHQPILWHIMKSYAAFGHKEFIVTLGYKSSVIKDYFLNYKLKNSSLSIDLKSNNVDVYGDIADDWHVHLIETGEDTLTGGRLKRVKEYVGNETFMLTYGDGVSDIDIDKLVAFHKSHGKLATLSAVRPPAKFGALDISDSGAVEHFSEKPMHGEVSVNGGFFVLEPEIFDYLDGDQTSFEREPLERLAADGQLMAYEHTGFWQCMDTLRDMKALEALWDGGNAPWKRW